MVAEQSLRVPSFDFMPSTCTSLLPWEYQRIAPAEMVTRDHRWGAGASSCQRSSGRKHVGALAVSGAMWYNHQVILLQLQSPGTSHGKHTGYAPLERLKLWLFQNQEKLRKTVYFCLGLVVTNSRINRNVAGGWRRSFRRICIWLWATINTQGSSSITRRLQMKSHLSVAVELPLHLLFCTERANNF